MLMSVIVHPGRLRQEMTRRGWAATDLAHAARLSQATISAAVNGRPISQRSLGLIAMALQRAPIIGVLIMSDAPDIELG